MWSLRSKACGTPVRSDARPSHHLARGVSKSPCVNFLYCVSSRRRRRTLDVVAVQDRSSSSLLGRLGRTSAILLVGVPALVVPSSSLSGASTRAPLVGVGRWNVGYTYRLSSLRSCEVGDANLAFVNWSEQPVRITSVTINANAALRATVSSSLVARKPGSTTGEVAASLRVPVVTSANVSRPAIRSEVKPYSKSRAWNFLVLRVRLHSDVAGPWTIRGADVIYAVGSRHYALHLDQNLVLPAVTGC